MRGPNSSTRGFTLIELVVSAALGVLVMALVGGMLVSTLNAQSSVRAAAQSSNTGQLVAKALTRDVRGARDLTTAVPFAGTCLLRLTVVDNALTVPVSVRFVAWYFGNGEIRTRRSTIAIPDPVSPTAVTTAWTLLATGVQRSGSTPVFTANGPQVGLTFTVAGSAGAPVLIQTTAISRQPWPTASPGVSSPCS